MIDEDLARWERDKNANRWRMPSAPAWKRWPIVRHIRVMLIRRRIEQWYRYGPGAIGFRTGYDEWVLFGIWRGFEERPP